MSDKVLFKGSAATLVLSVLKAQPMYGYELLQAIEQRSGGAFQLGEGTLYPVLHALEAGGDLEAFWTKRPGERRRKYYRLTEQGLTALARKQEAWRTFRDTVDRVLAWEGA